MKQYDHKLRLTTTEVRNYSQSNRAVNVSFDSLREAKKHVENEFKIHPKSAKTNNTIFNKKSGVIYKLDRYDNTWGVFKVGGAESRIKVKTKDFLFILNEESTIAIRAEKVVGKFRAACKSLREPDGQLRTPNKPKSLWGAFLWSETEEGHNFWSEIAHKYELKV